MTCSTFDRYCSRQILGFATLRCLEKVPTKIIPNGGCYNYVMVICHGRIPKKTQKTTNPRIKNVSQLNNHQNKNQQIQGIQGSYMFFHQKKHDGFKKCRFSLRKTHEVRSKQCRPVAGAEALSWRWVE